MLTVILSIWPRTSIASPASAERMRSATRPPSPDIDAGQDGRELLPAIACDEIARPHRIAQKIGKSQQGLVAAGMAKPFIDVREKVEVHHQDARGCIVHLRAPTETIALFEEGSAIRQFRQFVGERELCVAVSQALGRHHQQTKRDADQANGGDEQCNAQRRVIVLDAVRQWRMVKRQAGADDHRRSQDGKCQSRRKSTLQGLIASALEDLQAGQQCQAAREQARP